MVRARLGVVLAACVLMGVAVVGCGQKEPGRYYDSQGFSIRFPEDWEKQQGVMGAAVIALSPMEGPDDPFRENVNVVVEKLPKSMTVEEYCRLGMTQMEKIMTDFQQQEKGAETINGARSE